MVWGGEAAQGLVRAQPPCSTRRNASCTVDNTTQAGPSTSNGRSKHMKARGLPRPCAGPRWTPHPPHTKTHTSVLHSPPLPCHHGCAPPHAAYPVRGVMLPRPGCSRVDHDRRGHERPAAAAAVLARAGAHACQLSPEGAAGSQGKGGGLRRRRRRRRRRAVEHCGNSVQRALGQPVRAGGAVKERAKHPRRGMEASRISLPTPRRGGKPCPSLARRGRAAAAGAHRPSAALWPRSKAQAAAVGGRRSGCWGG